MNIKERALPGDKIIYANGKEVTILGFPLVNGVPSVLVDPHDSSVMMSGRSYTIPFVNNMLETRVWKLKEQSASIVRRDAR